MPVNSLKMPNHVAQVGDVHRSSLVRPFINSLGTDGCGWLWVGVEKDTWLVPRHLLACTLRTPGTRDILQ